MMKLKQRDIHFHLSRNLMLKNPKLLLFSVCRDSLTIIFANFFFLTFVNTIFKTKKLLSSQNYYF